MEQRRYVITGANRGIGLELARAVIARGHEVWGTARERSPQALLALGPAGTVQLELDDQASIDAAVERLSATVDSIDVLVNCAGVNALAGGAAPDARGVLEVSASAFELVQRINVVAPMLLTRGLVPLLRASSNPLIANISSQLGSMEFSAASGSDVAYNVSKAALNMLTVRTAAELRSEGIAAVMLHPGWVSTDMGGSAAPLTPVESATALADTIESLTLEDSGSFLRWDGTIHPW